MNRYLEMKQRQQEEFNALPVGFAFSKAQFDELMQSWGLDPEKDLDKIYRIPGGGFVQKKHHKLLHDTLDKFDAELDVAIKGDAIGDGFIYDMFDAELSDHEYGYTHNATDTLRSLGITREDLYKDARLMLGFRLACKSQVDWYNEHN